MLRQTGWWFQPLWKILVSENDYSQYLEKYKMFQTTNQQKSIPSCCLACPQKTWLSYDQSMVPVVPSVCGPAFINPSSHPAINPCEKNPRWPRCSIPNEKRSSSTDVGICWGCSSFSQHPVILGSGLRASGILVSRIPGCWRWGKKRLPQCSWYTLWLSQNSYWKLPFIVDFPIESGDFP